jgi:hypothetical protein
VSDHRDDGEDEDRAAILARRAKFVATALVGLTGLTACDPRPQPCLEPVPLPPPTSPADPPPMPCLTPMRVEDPADAGAPPAASDAGAPPDGGAADAGAGDAGPRDAGPQDAGPDAAPAPCLRYAPPPKPLPCLTPRRQ